MAHNINMSFQKEKSERKFRKRKKSLKIHSFPIGNERTHPQKQNRRDIAILYITIKPSIYRTIEMTIKVSATHSFSTLAVCYCPSSRRMNCHHCG